MVESDPDEGRRVRTEGFDIVVPNDWWRIPLKDRISREASVKALIKRQFANTQASAALRHDTEQALITSTAESARNRGVLFWIATGSVDGFPMPMSLLMTELDPFLVRSYDHAAEQLATRQRVDTARMRPGRVLRHVYRRVPGTGLKSIAGLDAPGTPLPATSETLQADYWMERPDGRVVQLAFATQLVRFEAPLLELFEAVVDSVTWNNREEDE